MKKLVRDALLLLTLGLLTHDANALSPQWTPVGPVYLTEGYNPSNQKNNGRIWNIAVDPSNTNHILIFSDSGGIWQTTNDGTTWTPQTDDYPSFNVSYNNNSGALAFCAGTPNIVYANTQPAEDGWGGVIESTDGGSTWNEIASYNNILGTNYYTNMRDMLVDPANSNNVEFDCRYSWYVGATWGNLGGVYKSTDGGANWTNTLQGTIGIPGPCLVASSSNFSNQYYANSSNIGSNAMGIYRSTNAGTSWGVISGPWSSVSGVEDLWVAIAPSDQNTVYVIASTGDYAYNTSGFYVTTDAWDPTPVWTSLTPPVSSPDGFKVNPTNSQMIYLNFYNYYCNSPCTDSWTNYETFNVAAGTTSAWTEYYAGNSPFHSDGRELCWQTDTNLLASCDGGIFISTDSGNTFSDSINEGGLQTMMIYGHSGSVQPGYPSNLVGGGTQDNGTQLYSGGGVFAESLAGGDGNSNQQDFFGDAVGSVASASNGTMYRATNINTWNNPSFYYTTAANQVGTLTGIQATARSYNNQNYVLAGAAAVLYQATDFWSNPTSGNVAWNNISSSIAPSGNIQYVEYAKSDATNNTIAFTTANNQIWVTSNGGASWNGSVTTGLPNRNLTQVTFDPTNANTLYVVFSGYDATTPSGHIFVTANALAASPTWTSIDDGVDIPHNCIAVDPVTPANLFVGTDIGMLYSTNYGANWTAMNPATTGMPNASVQQLMFEKTTDTLTAWTFGRGIFQMQMNNYTATPTFTPTITPTFGTCSSWVLNGNAVQGTAVTMTTAVNGQTSSAWNRTCINLTQTFNMTFKAYFGAAAGADGMDFVLQNDPRGTAAIGGGGSDKGYSNANSGTAITPSMALCLETYASNGTLQPEENGSTTSTCGYTTGGTCPFVFGTAIDNGVEHTYNVTWNPAAKVLTLIMDGAVVMTYDRDLIANVFGGSACVYYGFTASTGGANNLQYFYQTNCFTPTPTPTVTFTYTQTPTHTATNTATSTATNSATNTATHSATNTATNSATQTATNTATESATNTATHTATNTSTPTATNSATNTATRSATNTATNSATQTATNTATESATNTATHTATNTPSSTATHSATNTATHTATNTLTNTATFTATFTPTNTTTKTASVAATYTPTWTKTVTCTLTPTITPTSSTNCPGIPNWSGNSVVYAVGQEVSYSGELYECIQGNISAPGAEPPTLSAYWKDMGPCGSTPTQTTGFGPPVIYPNPAPGPTIQIHVPLNAPENVTVKIFTLSFRRIQERIFDNLVPGTDISLPLTDSWGYQLANGLYYVMVDVGGTKTICKLLIIR